MGAEVDGVALCFIVYYYQLLSCVLTTCVACEHAHNGSADMMMFSRCNVYHLHNLMYDFSMLNLAN